MYTEVLVRLVEIICKVWVDDIIVEVRTPRELVQNFVTVAKRLREKGR